MAKIGVRATLIVGSLITTAGYIGSSFAKHIMVFFCTYGVVSAIGISCLQMGAIVPLSEYFDKYKAFANGLVMASYSLGHFMWPPLVNELFKFYGWRGIFLIMAGFQLNVCVLGAL